MECTCGKKAVHFRRYEGNAYCGPCLTQQVEKKFFDAASQLLEYGDRVAVGVSGGKDSSVMLHLLKKFQDRVRGHHFEMVAIAMDEGIPGYRDTSLKFAKQLCDELDVELRVCSFGEELGVRIGDLNGVKHCTYCGVFRRGLLNRKASELGCNKLAVGHNMDDEAQTVFMNVIRNDTEKFAPRKRVEGAVERVKPLLDIAEKEVAAYAVLNEIPFFDGECPNSHDNMRREAMGIINGLEARHPGTKIQLLRFAQNIRTEPNRTEAGRCECGQPTSGDVCKACQLLEKAKSQSSSSSRAMGPR